MFIHIYKQIFSSARTNNIDKSNMNDLKDQF